MSVAACYADLSSDNKKLRAWMGSIPDGENLTALTIPGTHDSGTWQGVAKTFALPGALLYSWLGPLGSVVGVVGTLGIMNGMAETQSRSIKAQLNAGIRFLDIRCRRVGNGLNIYHDVFDVQLTFKDVLTTCKDFLRENKTECVLMSVKAEDNENEDPAWVPTFKAYCESDPSVWYSLSTETPPTLGDARGKIVLIRRFCATAPLGVPLAVDGNPNVQDNYKVDSVANNKWGQIQDHMNKALSGSKQDLYVNFASGVNGNDPIWGGTPKAIAGKINQKLKTFFESADLGRYGIIVLDFFEDPDELVRRIIATNPAYKREVSWFRLLSKNHQSQDNKKYLDAGDGTDAGGDNTRMTGYKNPHTLWRVELVFKSNPGVWFRLANQYHEEGPKSNRRFLDGGNANRHAYLTNFANDCTTWKAEAEGADGWFRLVNYDRTDNKYLDAGDDGPYMSNYNNDDHTLWKFESP